MHFEKNFCGHVISGGKFGNVYNSIYFPENKFIKQGKKRYNQRKAIAKKQIQYLR